MDYFGHGQVLDSIRKVTPRLTILSGPPSVGKWTMAEFLREEWGVLPSDVLRVNRLTADNSRVIETFALQAPTGPLRLVIARLDKSSVVSTNILLKVLEESPSTTRFFFTAGTDLEIPPTIRSRAQCFSLSPLTPEEVADILVHVKKFPASTAADRAALSQGSVKTALEVPEILANKNLVLRVLEAFRTHDVSILESVASRWTDAHTELLTIFCHEAVTKRWRLFSEAESGFSSPHVPLRILTALRAEVRPRLVVRASLINALLGEK